MAFTQADLGRSYSIGPVKQQRVSIAAASGDTGATVTFDNLSSVESMLITGVVCSSVVYNNDNTVTIIFADPLASVVGIAEAHGK